MKEAIHSLDLLGVKESNVIFLGYGNEWQGATHIYNSKSNECILSVAGRTETYGIKNHPEYCWQKYHLHHSYTRDNFKADLKSAITDIMPDICFCVDYDIHPDHRATSLLFEECMGEILKEKDGYFPLILKKFGYAGTWEGPDDYYEYAPTCNSFEDNRTDNPAFLWNERIRIRPDEK